MAPYAREWSRQSGFPPALLLTLMSVESGRGTSPLAREDNNHAGIMYTQHAPAAVERYGRRWGKYPDLASFGRDFVRVLRLSYNDRARRLAREVQLDPDLFEAFALGSREYVGGPGLSWDENAHSGPTNEPGYVLKARYRSDRKAIEGALLTEGHTPPPTIDPTPPADDPPADDPAVIVRPSPAGLPDVTIQALGAVGSMAAVGLLLAGIVAVVIELAQQDKTTVDDAG